MGLTIFELWVMEIENWVMEIAHPNSLYHGQFYLWHVSTFILLCIFYICQKKKKEEKKGHHLGQLCTIMQIYVPKIYPLVGNIVHNMGIALVITSLGIYTWNYILYPYKLWITKNEWFIDKV